MSRLLNRLLIYAFFCLLFCFIKQKFDKDLLLFFDFYQLMNVSSLKAIQLSPL